MIKIIVIFLISLMTSLFVCRQDPILEDSIQRGALVYEDFCVTCHMHNGKGFGNIYPPLAGSDFLLKKRSESIRAVKYGLTGKIIVNGKTYDKTMDPLGLSNEEVTDVMNFILHSWGNTSNQIITLAEVASILE